MSTEDNSMEENRSNPPEPHYSVGSPLGWAGLPYRAILDLIGKDPSTTRTKDSPAVILQGRGKPAWVNGKEKPINASQDDVLEALIAARPIGLTKDALEANSGHSDARGILTRMIKKDPDWAAVIHMAGVCGGRYRID